MKKLFLTLFAFLSLVSGFAAGAAGYGAANSSMLVNNLDNAILRSTVVSPLAAGAGHVVGGTAAGLFQGQKLGEAVINSFDGFGRSMVIGAAVGITTTIAVSYAQGINPWTGKAISPQTNSTSKHAQQRTTERNIPQSAIDDALKNPLKVTDVKYDTNGPSIKYIGNKVTVVVNPETGNIITVYPTSTQRVNSILKTVKE